LRAPPSQSNAPRSAYCDADLAPAERAADLAQRLSLYDWQSLLQNGNVGVPRFGIPPVAFNEALHGVVFGCGPTHTDNATGYTSSGCPTSFPHATLMGGAFNRSLWRSVASAISDEGRALHNSNGYALLAWAPDINPFRDPRWGRGQEVAGEDPFHIAEYIYEYARGLQEGEDPRYTKLVSTAKHATGYDLENWAGNDRNSFTARISLHDAVEYFWPPFESATQRGHVKSIMCSYNAVDLGGAGEVPSCAWGWFQMDVLRGEWGWDGFIVSDCGAIADINVGHHYVGNMSAAAAAGILAGTDVNCGSVYSGNIALAVGEGLMALEDVAAAGRRFLAVVFGTGLFDPPERVPYNRYGPEKVDSLANRRLAFEAAVQGIALLANGPTSTPWGEGLPLLPLRAAALRGKTVAVIGPNANSTALLSIYTGSNAVVANQSVLSALQRRGAAEGFAVTSALGCSWSCGSTAGFAAAVAAAAAADVVVLAVGLYPGGGGSIPDGGPTQEDEGFDRSDLALPGSQATLVAAVAAAGRPVVLVLIHGGPLALDAAALALPAVVDAHYPGEIGGDAVAHVLFGDSPMAASGRLTTTVYPAEFAQQRNMSDYELAPHGAVPGVTHLYYSGGAEQWPFGFGLSYASFTFEWLDGEPPPCEIAVEQLARGAAPPFAVNVTNTGAAAADVSALAFVSTGVPGEPLQKLFDFQRAADVQPGQSVVLQFTLPPAVAAAVTREGARVLRAGAALEVAIGDVPRGARAPGSGLIAPAEGERAGARARARVLLTGEADAVVTRAPPPQQQGRRR